MYCAECKKELNIEDKIGEKDWATTFLLSSFMGLLGLHRFYTGYIGIGIAQALTLGGFGLWSLIDWISICTNHYRDFENKRLKDYVKSLGLGTMYAIFAFIFMMLLIMTVIMIITLQISK